MFAVIETGGKQYLVKTGDVIKIEKLDAASGDTITFDNVLLKAKDDGTDVEIGTPYVSGATVTAKVEEQGRDKKVRVVKYKRKVRYKKVFGHRQPFTRISIEAIA